MHFDGDSHRLDLSPACSVMLWLETAEGEALFGYDVEARDENGELLPRLSFGQLPAGPENSRMDGVGCESFPFRLLPAGKVVFHVSKDGREHSRHAVQLPASTTLEPRTLVIVLEP